MNRNMRRLFLISAMMLGLFFGGLSAVQAQTQTAPPEVQRVVQMLLDEGYALISLQRTWLGRVRIELEKENLHREVVMNPQSGEILRDMTRLIGAAPAVASRSPSTSTGGGGGDDGNGDDDGGDDGGNDDGDEDGGDDEPDDHEE